MSLFLSLGILLNQKTVLLQLNPDKRIWQRKRDISVSLGDIQSVAKHNDCWLNSDHLPSSLLVSSCSVWKVNLYYLWSVELKQSISVPPVRKVLGGFDPGTVLSRGSSCLNT